MQLGFVSAILPELSLNEVLEDAVELDFDCVEVMCWPSGPATRRYAGVTHIDVISMDDDAAKSINELAWQREVKISGLGYYGNLLSANPEEAAESVSHLQHVIRACAKLGAPRVNTFVGRDWKKTIDQNFEQFSKVWKPLVQLAEDVNVSICIENCPMLFTDDEWPGGKNLAVSPAIWRRMFEEIPSDHFGLNYDPSHLLWQQMDYLQPMREFASRIFHVHAKDLHIDRQQLNDVGILATPSHYSVEKLPGRGDVNWDEFFKVLEETNYTGPVCVEVEDREYEDTLEHRRLALQESSKFLRKYIPQE